MVTVHEEGRSPVFLSLKTVLARLPDDMAIFEATTLALFLGEPVSVVLKDGNGRPASMHLTERANPQIELFSEPEEGSDGQSLFCYTSDCTATGGDIMMMSVFQPDRARYELDHLNCIAAASTPENADLVVLAVDTRHSVLVGLDNQSVVIKPVEDGDERLSYIALYDTCYTAADLDRMKRAGAKTPEDAPLDTFQLDLDFVIEGTFEVSVKLRALHHGDARVRLRALMENDVMFREAVIEEVQRVARRDGEIPWRVRESESSDVDELPADRDYEVLSRDT